MCTETAQCHLFLSAMALTEQPAAVLTGEGLGDDLLDGWDRDESGAVAIARGPDELWRILDESCGVSVDGQVRFRLPFVPSAAAFTPDGRRLAAANGDWLVVIDVDAPAILRRFNMPR